jgi:hypothetical protein
MEKLITYFGQPAKVACDEKCNKAWGVVCRPRVYPEISETEIFGLNGKSVYPSSKKYDEESYDIDNHAYCSDDELGNAPNDPGTYEGGDGKPTSDERKGNKWCVRQCERCVMSDIGKHKEPLELPDFSKRIYNIEQ